VNSSDVWFGVSAEVAFDYLADPRNRPAWQLSLRRVELVDAGPPQVGQRWIDVTWPGFKPRMRTTGWDRPAYWAERGTWRGLTVHVGLTFTSEGDGCWVRLQLRGLPQVVRRLAIRDLRRAAVLLRQR